jgi:hypothetical protein
MVRDDDEVKFRRRELRGSRLRCLMFTNMPNDQIKHAMNVLVSPYACGKRGSGLALRQVGGGVPITIQPCGILGVS